MRKGFLTTAALAAALLMLVGCGSSGGDQPAALSADGKATISTDNFKAWQTAAKAVAVLECETPKMLFPDTGESVVKTGEIKKVKSKQTPSFQCGTALRLTSAIQLDSDEVAEKNSDFAASVERAPDELRLEKPTDAAPKGASCLRFKQDQGHWTCAVAWHNLQLRSESYKSIDEASEMLAGMHKVVEEVYGASGQKSADDS